MRSIRIGTRNSRLSLVQTEIAMERMKQNGCPFGYDIVEISTLGDKRQDIPLDTMGGKGIFVKDIEEALLRDEIDLAVHSLKDMPAVLHEDLTLAAFMPRENAADCLISREGIGIEELPEGAVVGTSSLRRTYQVKALRPDLEVRALRGNVHTRLAKLDEGQYDAVVLAAAGLIRLGLSGRITQYLPIDRFVPCVGQGIIAIETKKKNSDIINFLKSCDDLPTRKAALCERAFLRKLNGDCSIPAGAYCRAEGDYLHITGMLGDTEKLTIYQNSLSGRAEDPELVGYRLAEQILAAIPRKVV